MASSMVIEALENSKKKYSEIKNNQKNYLAHLELVRKVDFQKIYDVNLSATFSPLWFSSSDNTLNILKLVGEKRGEGYYPIKSLMDKNVICGFGSDWPVSDFNPFYGIEVAVTHKDIGMGLDLPKFNEQQLLNIYEAVNGYTISSAKLLNLDDITGSLEVGKFLDFIVVDRNIFEIEENKIHSTKVEKTYISGNLVFNSQK